MTVVFILALFICEKVQIDTLALCLPFILKKCSRNNRTYACAITRVDVRTNISDIVKAGSCLHNPPAY